MEHAKMRGNTQQPPVPGSTSDNPPQNTSLHVWGIQSNARADLVALLSAIKLSPLLKSLKISTRSGCAIRSVVYYAAKNEACGWRCTSGDILTLIFQWIKARSAPIRFVQIKKSLTDNVHLRAAKDLADIGCNSPRSQTSPDLQPKTQIFGPPGPPIAVDKVITELPDDSSTLLLFYRNRLFLDFRPIQVTSAPSERVFFVADAQFTYKKSQLNFMADWQSAPIAAEEEDWLRDDLVRVDVSVEVQPAVEEVEDTVHDTFASKSGGEEEETIQKEVLDSLDFADAAFPEMSEEM
ncbi:hypothetical protein B0H13DRAFT_2310205 [Mycena leptocephala]|nr:hypothetical protein B0H13DRAFT_2310205 [Mycena leptocephala]